MWRTLCKVTLHFLSSVEVVAEGELFSGYDGAWGFMLNFYICPGVRPSQSLWWPWNTSQKVLWICLAGETASSLEQGCLCPGRGVWHSAAASSRLQQSNAHAAPADQQGVQDTSHSEVPGEQILRAGEEKKSSFPGERDAVCQSLTGVRWAELFCTPCTSQAEGPTV